MVFYACLLDHIPSIPKLNKTFVSAGFAYMFAQLFGSCFGSLLIVSSFHSPACILGSATAVPLHACLNLSSSDMHDTDYLQFLIMASYTVDA